MKTNEISVQFIRHKANIELIFFMIDRGIKLYRSLYIHSTDADPLGIRNPEVIADSWFQNFGAEKRAFYAEIVSNAHRYTWILDIPKVELLKGLLEFQPVNIEFRTLVQILRERAVVRLKHDYKRHKRLHDTNHF